MKYIKILLFVLFLAPFGVHAASNDFMVAAQLLSAAKNADIQQVQILINNGANVNFVDSTGLSIVCTALMNNDVRAAQILQMYGADAAQCDRQIKNYRAKKKQPDTGGLFSGLSSAQGMLLAAAGAAVVVGGLFLLTDVFDPDNGNGNGSSGSGNRPGQGSTGDGSGTSTAKLTVPYGPAMPNATTENANYGNNLNTYSPSTDGILKDNFAYMSNNTGQNYLLMMHGYSPLARGYQGMRTLRYTDRSPVPTSALGAGGGISVGGGRPVGVALVTDNGVNALPVQGDDSLPGKNSLDDKLMLWTTVSNNAVVSVAETYLSSLSSKYYNNKIVLGDGESGAALSGATTVEDVQFVDDFDLSGFGTAVNNMAAANTDDLLAKVVGGSYSGYSTADYYGFMPNGQMAIFRTGGGNVMKSVAGTYTMAGATLATNDTITLFGTRLTVTRTDDNIVATNGATTYNGTIDSNGYLTIDRSADGLPNLVYSLAEGKMTPIASGTYTMAGDALATGDTLVLNGRTLTVTRTGNTVVATDDDVTYSGYVGANGLLYLNSGVDTDVTVAYQLANNNITISREVGTGDYYNYRALLKSATLYGNGDLAGGRSAPEILANASVIEPLRLSSVDTIDDILSWSESARANQFSIMVNKYYNDTSDDEGNPTPGSNAINFFNNLGSTYSPLVIFSTGSFDTGNAQYAGKTEYATFENVAPLVFDNLEHLFMSVVAVGLQGGRVDEDTCSGGTCGANDVAGFKPSTKYVLTQWSDNNGTPSDASDDKYYKARKCGISGSGTIGENGVDPWCFAAAGMTDELAVSAAAGAAGAVKSAFSYMNNKQVFALMALTADGAYLGTDTNGTAFNKDTLTAYLKNLYQMPTEDEYRWQSGVEDYLDVFKDVFGYGLINLERATTPNKTIYYYDGTKIVSDNGNAYWRAAQNTTFRTSSVFAPRAATISAPFFDVLESVDGELSMPRIWKNEFTIGSADKRGLYMGDVLGELKTRDVAPHCTTVGNPGFTMAMSERPYTDNLLGLDKLSMDYTADNWNLAAGYQRYFTNGNDRFSGRANPVLGLATNVVTSDAAYKFGRFAFGARAFSGLVTDENLLENDPTLAAQYIPAELGRVMGWNTDATYNDDMFGVTVAFGNVRESDTLLGAQTDGLLALGAGDTTYVDTEFSYRPIDKVKLSARATFARTESDAAGAYVLGMSDIESDAFSFGLDAGSFSFTVARPLAVRSGSMKYAYADYDVAENADGNFDLVVKDAHLMDLALSPEHRELRLSGSYRHNFGEFTDGAIGFIYRVNPNNTREFGNESIFMLKMTHRIGI